MGLTLGPSGVCVGDGAAGAHPVGRPIPKRRLHAAPAPPDTPSNGQASDPAPLPPGQRTVASLFASVAANPPTAPLERAVSQPPLVDLRAAAAADVVFGFYYDAVKAARDAEGGAGASRGAGAPSGGQPCLPPCPPSPAAAALAAGEEDGRRFLRLLRCEASRGRTLRPSQQLQALAVVRGHASAGDAGLALEAHR